MNAKVQKEKIIQSKTRSYAVFFFLFLKKIAVILSSLRERIEKKFNLQILLDVFFQKTQKAEPSDGQILLLKKENHLRVELLSFPETVKNLESTYYKIELNPENSPILYDCLNEKKTLNIFREEMEQFEHSILRNLLFYRFKLWNVKNIVYLPVYKGKQEVIGILILFNLNEVIPGKKILKIQKIIKKFAGIIYYQWRKKSLEELTVNFEWSREKYNRLLKLSSKINMLLEQKDFFKILIDELMNIFGFEMGILLLEKNKKLPFITGDVSKPEYLEALEKQLNYFGQIENAPDVSDQAHPDGVSSLVFLNNTPVYFYDMQAIDSMPMSPKSRFSLDLVKPLIVKSLVHIPIRDNGEPIGTLQLWSFSTAVSLSQDDIDIICHLCSFVPSVLRNSKIYSILEGHTKSIQNKNKQLREELKLAEQIQTNIIPSNYPKTPGVRFASFYKAMQEVGGDFYDFVQVREPDMMGIFISDISGHGVPAAFITSMLKIILDTCGAYKFSPSSLMHYLNSKLLALANGNFITAFYGLYNSNTRKFIYARASHPYPVLIRNGELTELKGDGMILGFFEEVSSDEKEIDLFPGDKLIFYTDGLTESLNSEGKFFRDRMFQVLKKNHHEPIDKIINLLHYELLLHCERDIFEDDVCIVGMEILSL